MTEQEQFLEYASEMTRVLAMLARSEHFPSVVYHLEMALLEIMHMQSVVQEHDEVS